MSEWTDVFECKLKKVPFILVVDTSRSMKENGRIEAVNHALEALISGLKEIQEAEAEWDIQLAILTFDQSARWVVPLTSVSEFKYQELHCLAGKASYAEAFRNLNEKLSLHEYMWHKGKLAQPQIFFLTASEPEEDKSYWEERETLLWNTWFRESMRTAILLGNAADSHSEAARAAREFVGMNEYGIHCLVDAEDVSLLFQGYLDQFKNSLLLSKKMSNGGVFRMGMKGLRISDSNNSDDWSTGSDIWDEIIESLSDFEGVEFNFDSDEAGFI